MDTSMEFGLSDERIIENMRGLAAIHILSREDESPLAPLMCEGRRELLANTVRDAFVESVTSLPAAVIDLDIDRLRLTLAVGRALGTDRLLPVARTLEQLVSARAMSMWCRLSGLEKEGSSFDSLAENWRKRLRALLTPRGFIREAV